MAVRPVLFFGHADAQVILETARQHHVAPFLLTMPDAASIHGGAYFAALESQLRNEFPDVDFTMIVDAGDAAGRALQALDAGVRHIALTETPADSAIQNIAATHNATLYPPQTVFFTADSLYALKAGLPAWWGVEKPRE